MNENEDITEKFFDACKNCLGPGEMAHESFFNLRYAMSAIDIMNPSMDSGMTKSRKVANLRQAIESGDLPLGPFEDQEVLLAVIDELIVLFVNWLTGDPLIQTVYTCMYMHCIPYIEDENLAIFCEALRRNIIFFRRVLLTLPSFEDEDFCPAQNKIPLTVNTKGMYPKKKISNSYFDFSNDELIALLESQQQKLLQSGTSETILSARLKLVTLLLKFELDFSEFLIVLADEDVEEAYENPELKEFGEVAYSYQNKPIKVVELTPDIFTFHCNKVLSISSEISEVAKTLLQTADHGKDAGPGKINPKSEFYSIPGFEPYLTLSDLAATVQRFPRILNRKSVFSFLACAFSRVIKVIDEMKRIINSNSLNVVFLHELCSVSHRLGHNVCHCLFRKDELSNPLEIKDASLKSCALSRGVMSVMMGVLFKCPVKVDPRISEVLSPSSSVMHLLASWLAVEPKWIRDRIIDNAQVIGNYEYLFENIFVYLYKICRCYTFNRSRQRTHISRLFEDLNNLIEESISIEATFSQHFLEDAQTPNSNSTQIPLHITSYICFFYYHLVWDYLITGFQLDLYAPREWVYVYALIITLQRNLSAFVTHMAKGINSLPPDGKVGQANNSFGSAVNNSKKRRRKRDLNGSTVSNKSRQTPLSQLFNLSPVSCEYWGFQIAQANLHRFLSLGTLYILRALQRDIGIDIKTMKPLDQSTTKVYSSLKTQFLRRMGPAIDSKFSPLLGNETADSFFDSTHEYVTSEIFSEADSKELLEMAGKVFGIARQWIHAANIPTLTSSFMGPVDDLAQLDHLAKNNEIVCRLLVARPEKRPSRSRNNDEDPTIRQTHPFHPVHFEFQHLLSKAYPLLRLA
ncbi:unnamed protein product [Rodentolepis nana]|uniref:Protein MAK10 homolog n=1 Tax=Rodentolepis nana TaxID=102285 RepID=A0A0R3TMQ8_RODNA|nr:unnamed protein product [Rodentolepis nana]